MILSTIREKFGAWVIGGIIVLLAFVFVIYGVFTPKATRGMHEGSVAGTVNGDSITLRDFNRAYNQRVEFYRNMMGGNVSDEQLRAFRLKDSVFQELVRRKLMVQAARAQRMEPSDEEVKDKIKEIPAFQKDGKFDVSTYKAVLESNQLTAGGFERLMREDLATQRWAEHFRRSVFVSEQEVKRKYLLSEDKRNIKYVLLTSEAGRRDVRVSEDDVKKYLADAPKLNVAKTQYEGKKDKEYKGKTFDQVKEAIAKDLIAGDRFDEIKANNQKIADRVLGILTADAKSDKAVNDVLKPYSVQVKSTGLVTAQGAYLPGIGESKELVADAFSTKFPIDPKRGGKTKKYSSGGWTLVAVVTETQLPDLAKLPAQRTTLMNQIAFGKERDLFEKWVKVLAEKAKIEPNATVLSDS